MMLGITEAGCKKSGFSKYHVWLCIRLQLTTRAADARGILANQKFFFTCQGRSRELERVSVLGRGKSSSPLRCGITLDDFSLPFPLSLPTPSYPSRLILTVQGGLEFVIHFSWDYMHVSTHLFYVVLGTKPKASWVLSKHSANGTHNSTLVFFIKQWL